MEEPAGEVRPVDGAAGRTCHVHGQRAVGPDLSHPGRSRSRSSTRVLVGRAPSSKEEHMSRNATYVKFALLMVLLVVLAMFMGSEPWGPI